MTECDVVKTPADPNVKLVRTLRDGCLLNVSYWEAVGSLLFLAMVSQPDIAYAAGVVSRYLDCYGKSHWRVVRRIMNYLKGTHGLLCIADAVGDNLVVFSDSDYAACVGTRCSTSGYLFMMNGSCVTRSFRRQPIIT